MSTQPTDAELDALTDEVAGLDSSDETFRNFARAVLQRWGQPSGAGEPVAWWIPKAEQFCIADKSGDRPFAKAWEPLYAAPQPTHAQAGAVPLTDGQAKEVLWTEHLRWMQAAGLDTEGMRPTGEWLDHWLTYVRAIERAHGIKGGQHGTE